MTQAPHAPATTPAGAISPGGETHERDWAVLELETLFELARIGTDIAERMNQQHAAAVAATPPGPARAALHRDVALAFTRIARAVRLTLAMFGRVRELREALAAGAVLPVAPLMPERPQPSAGAGQSAVAEAARAPARNPDELELEAKGGKRDDADVGDGPAPVRRTQGSNRPDRESLTEFADFGFSLAHCHPGEVIARIYRDLGLPPDPARWPQAWPNGVPAGKPDRSRSIVLPRPAARGEVGSPLGLPGEGPALTDGKGPHPVSLREPDLSRDPRVKPEGERQFEMDPLPSPPGEDSS